MAPRKARFPGGGFPMLPAGVDPARGMFGTRKKEDDDCEPTVTNKKARSSGNEKWPTQGGVASALGLMAGSSSYFSTLAPSLAGSSGTCSTLSASSSACGVSSAFSLAGLPETNVPQTPAVAGPCGRLEVKVLAERADAPEVEFSTRGSKTLAMKLTETP